ncbi:MAG TPA: hypothetical protein V6D27_06740 [Vampirovibrionales bacterium]
MSFHPLYTRVGDRFNGGQNSGFFTQSLPSRTQFGLETGFVVLFI